MNRDEGITMLRNQAALLRREPNRADQAAWLDRLASRALDPEVVVSRGARGAVRWRACVVVFEGPHDPYLFYRSTYCCSKAHGTPSAAEKCGRKRLAAHLDKEVAAR